MSYRLRLTNEAEKQLLQWKKSGQKKDIMKILSLFNELKEHPSTGTGQIEQLKGNLSGYWSRRINKHSRIIYSIYEDIATVEVISLKSHYGDK
jgi:toxin YoeB